jgi:hypothetical protein
MLNTSMPYPDRQELLHRVYTKQKARSLSGLQISEIEFLKYPKHQTSVCILSRVADPDTVVIYTYGGLTPHFFYYNADGTIADKTGDGIYQFTWEWMHYWLDQNVAVAIFDVPDYFVAYGKGWVGSFYRESLDRRREALQVIDILSNKFPNATLNWFGISYGAIDVANISLIETKLHKIVSASGTWHVLDGVDKHHQGARLDNYDVTDSKTPMLIVMHEKEVWEKAQEQMSKTDSILVTNNVSAEDGHYFRKRQKEVITAICDWFRDKPIPKIIP